MPHALAATPTREQPEVLLRIRGVMARTGLTRAGVYRACAAGLLPRPVKLGPRASAWESSAVDRYVAERIATRDGERAA